MVEFPLFSDVFGTKVGGIKIDGEKISVKYGEVSIKSSLSYLKEASIIERHTLGKIRAKIVLFDYLGDKNEFEVFMSEPNFFNLRGFLINK